MNPSQDLAPIVRDWLHEPDGLPPPRIAQVGPLIHQTPQERGIFPHLGRGRFQNMFSATTYALATALVALVGGFLLSGVLMQGSSDEPQLAPAAGSSSALPTATMDPTAEPEQATADRATDARIAGDGPWLRLERSLEERDALFEAERAGLLPRRYVGYDGEATGMSEPWPTRWQAEGFGSKVAMSTDETVEPPLLQVAVQGPAGRTVRQRLGRQASPFPPLRGWGSDSTPAIVLSGTGILIRGDGDESVRAWYSTDGERWTERRPWLRGDTMIGTPDGFVRIRGQRLHRSTDGRGWTQIPGMYPDATYVGRWEGDQIFGYWSEDGPRVGRLSDTGIDVFPYSAEAFGSQRPDRGTRGQAVAEWSECCEADDDGAIPPNLLSERRFTVVGGLGIVHLDRSNRTIVFTPDGTRWSAVTMPEDWLPLSKTPPNGAFGNGAGATYAWVTDDSVVISASVMAPGVGDDQRSEQTYRATMVDSAAEPSGAATSQPVPMTGVDDASTISDVLPGVELVTEDIEPGLFRIVSDGHREPRLLLDVEVDGDGAVWVLRVGDVIRLGDGQPSLEIGWGELGLTPSGEITARDFNGLPEYSVLEDGAWGPLSKELIPCEDGSQGQCLRVPDRPVSIRPDGAIVVEGWPKAFRLPDELRPMTVAVDASGQVWLVAEGPSSRPAQFMQPDGKGVEYEVSSGELYVLTPEAVAADA